MQAQYISMFEAQGIRVAVLDQPIEVQFVSTLESYSDGVKFLRIDADIAGALKGEEAVADGEALTALFKKASGEENLTVELLSLKDESVPLLLTVSEEARRMEDMMKYFAAAGNGFTPPPMPNDLKLTVNTASPLIRKLTEMSAEKQEAAATYLYRSALLSQKKLTAEELQSFLAAGYGLLELL